MVHKAGETLVLMHNVGVRQGQNWLVEDIDLSIGRGEIVTLIGPNGSGKTTIARLVTGVLKPTTGTLTRRERLRIGHVPQKLNLDWTLPLSVRRLMVLTNNQPKDKILEELERVGVAHLKEVAVQRLSGGEFQRVLLARAMIREPDLLVLDEPVQGVDIAGQLALYELILDIRDRTGCAILLISHDLHVVMARTDRVLCLDGHVCCSGPPEQVAKSPEYLALFSEQARHGLAIYQHRHDHLRNAEALSGGQENV